MIHIIIQYCSRWMMDMWTVLPVFIAEPDSSRKEGPAESFLHTERLDQSVTEAALQSRQFTLQAL